MTALVVNFAGKLAIAAEELLQSHHSHLACSAMVLRQRSCHESREGIATERLR